MIADTINANPNQLWDLCYAVNALCLLFLWVFPHSTILFMSCYCLSHGPLATAIATWRVITQVLSKSVNMDLKICLNAQNSLVFHSLDKVTSLYIHIYPAFTFFVCIRDW